MFNPVANQIMEQYIYIDIDIDIDIGYKYMIYIYIYDIYIYDGPVSGGPSVPRDGFICPFFCICKL
jgi:hypothetical protein